MSRVTVVSMVICVVCLALVASCAELIPNPDKYISIHPLRDRLISYDKMTSVLSEHNIKIPFYEPASGAFLHAIVVRFNIEPMSGDVTYDEVQVTMDILESDGTRFYEDTGNIEVLTAIPESIDRSVDREESLKIAANLAAAGSVLSGSVSAEASQTERYARLYRTVTASIPSPTQVSWVFTPFKDEPVFPGNYYVVALVEVRDPTPSYSVEVYSDCRYGKSFFFGLWREKKYCVSDAGELDLVRGGQPVPPSAPTEVELGAEAFQVASLGTWGSEGDGDGQFRRPWGIGAAYEMVYVTDSDQMSVQIFSPRGEYLGRLPGEIIGSFLAVDSNGLVYAINYDPATARNQRVEVYAYGSHELENEFALLGTSPRGIAVDIYGENIYVTDITDQNVRRYAPDGQVTAEWGWGGTGDGEFQDPWGIAMDRYNTGQIYVADLRNHRVQVFSPDGEFLAKWGTYGTGEGQFDFPVDVAVDTSGNVFVLDSGNNRVQMFSPEGEFLGMWGSVGRGEGEFLDPYGIAVDLEDNVYVLDSGNHRVQVFRVASTP